MELKKTNSASLTGAENLLIYKDSCEIISIFKKKIEELYENEGIRVFYCGSYTPIDYYAARAVCSLKSKYQDIKLITTVLSCFLQGRGNLFSLISECSDCKLFIKTSRFDYRLIHDCMIDNSVQLLYYSEEKKERLCTIYLNRKSEGRGAKFVRLR